MMNHHLDNRLYNVASFRRALLGILDEREKGIVTCSEAQPSIALTRATEVQDSQGWLAHIDQLHMSLGYRVLAHVVAETRFHAGRADEPKTLGYIITLTPPRSAVMGAPEFFCFRLP